MKRPQILFFMTLITFVLCVVSYFWIDRAVATFAFGLNLRRFSLFYAIQWFPALFIYFSALALVYYTIQIARDKVGPHCRIWAMMAVAFIVAESITDKLKMVFGRYWPATWVENNPSFISHGVYGFNWFSKGAAFRSFPSGHSVAIFSVMTLVFMFYPRLRWLAVLGCAAVVTGLLADYYHFVSDIIAGAYIGTVVAMVGGWGISPPTPTYSAHPPAHK